MQDSAEISEESTGSSSQSGDCKDIAFELREWNALSYDWRAPFTMVVSASRNSGKSYMIKHMYKTYWHVHFDSVVVFSHSVCNGFYEDFIPGKLLFSNYSENVMAKVVQKATAMKAARKRYRVLVIMDDCLNRKNAYSQSLNKLFSMGRHINISCVIVSQTLKTYFSGLMRENTNLLMVLYQRSKSEKMYLYEKFLDDRIDDDDLPPRWQVDKKRWCMQMLKQRCRNYWAVVVEMESQALDYKDVVFKYRA